MSICGILNSPGRNVWWFFLGTIAFLFSCSRLDRGSDSGSAGQANVRPGIAEPNLLTQHNDLARTGANLKERFLNISNVNPSHFGKLFEKEVDGDVYAQPLYVPNLQMGNGTVRNVVFVMTHHNSVYAFDADDGTVPPLWTRNLGTPVPPQEVDPTYRDIRWEIGITATPVIDPSTHVMYLTSVRKEPDGNTMRRLYAINISNGTDKVPPVPIEAVYINHNDGIRVVFENRLQLQRTGLALWNGVLYIAFASYGDWGRYHGWVLAYTAKNLELVDSYVTAPHGYGSGIWQSGQALAIDNKTGYVFFTTGNDFEADKNSVNDNRSNAVGALKLSSAGTLDAMDWFTPHDWQALDIKDQDLGSSGVLLIPNTDLALTGSKAGKFYLLKRSNLGKITPKDQGAVQIVQVTPANAEFRNIHGGPVYWDGPEKSYIYVWGESDHLKAYEFKNGLLSPTPVSRSTMTAPLKGMPGGILSLTADGNQTGTGIVWANVPLEGDANTDTRPGLLRAFSATDLSKELWNSETKPQDKLGNFAKFSAPTVMNGKVYMATFRGPQEPAHLVVYGLK